MKTYKKIHESKEVANIHIAKIKSNGGTVITRYLNNGNVELTYYFDSDVKDFKKLILKAVSENKKITVKYLVFSSGFRKNDQSKWFFMQDMYNVDKWNEWTDEKQYIKAIMQRVNYFIRRGFPNSTEIG
jgi:hypothetical protein